ncbi:hypothetical protein HBH52_096590 [Parastagonospora nodorum]|nr:hypothetical protein HBH52_096590 [Parastagonospora nodorum]
MSQTNVREEYRIITLEVIKLIENLTSYTIMLAKVRQYSAKVKIENLSNMLTLTLSKTAQRQSSSVMSNKSTALITNKFSVASLTKLAILNNANITLVDAVHYSVVKQFSMFRLITKESQQKLEENYFKVRAQHLKYDALIQHLLLPKPPLKRRKTKAADSRYTKASRGRTKKDKDSENSNTSSDVPRLRRRDRAAACAQLAKRKQLGKEAQLKKTRDKEELAKAKKEKEEKEAQKRKTYSLDINSKDNLEDEKATTAKDLAREQKERLKALLNAKVSCDFTLYQLIDAYILYFKELLSNNSRIFANAIGIGKTRAIVLATEVQNTQAESDATEHNAVNNNDKLCPTKGKRTFYCANSPPENMSRLIKEEAIKMQINTTNAISKALAATNKLVALQSYVLEGFIIVYSFRKIDKHVFRAYNTISVTAQQTIIRKGGPYIEKRAILLPNSVTSNRIYKIEDAVYQSIAETLSYRTRQNTALNSLAIAKQYCLYPDFLSTVQNAKQQCRDILEKEGLNESEASRHIIFNRFKMQAIASYPALATLKAAQFKTYSSCKVKRFTLNSVKDLFTNLSKDYFLVREARAITKSSLKFQNLSNLCSKVKILETPSRT